MSVMVIAQTMLKLFIILMLGFVLNKVNIFDSETCRKLSSLVTKLTAPLLIISSSLSASADNRGEVLMLFGAGFLMYIGFMIFAWIVTTVLRFPKKEKPIYECMMVFSNNAFMGYPVLQSVLGDQAVFYSSMLHFSFNIFIYTYAAWCFKKTFGESNTQKQEDKLGRKARIMGAVSSLLTPGFILILLALVIYLVGIRDDGIVYSTCYMVGNMTSPLSMMILGATFAQYPIKESLTDIKSYGFSIIRLIIIPVISYFLCRLIGVNDYYTAIVTITNAMPVASFVLMMANEYKADNRVVVRNIVVTTALSLVTIPIIVSIFLV